MRGKLCTVPPQIFGDFPAQVDAALAADFLDRACPGWEEDKEVSKQDYSAALQSELSEGGFGMGSESFGAKQSVHW